MGKSNADAALERMNQHFKSCSRRSLTTLWKFLICKTYGISHLVYIVQTIKLCENDFKMIDDESIFALFEPGLEILLSRADPVILNS